MSVATLVLLIFEGLLIPSRLLVLCALTRQQRRRKRISIQAELPGTPATGLSKSEYYTVFQRSSHDDSHTTTKRGKHRHRHFQHCIYMDPFRNPGLQNAKLASLLSHTQQQSTTESADMVPPPPAYHTVVDPTAPIPNMHNPYEPEDDEDEIDNFPEINVNAMTQVRGHGNIISIPQMDSTQIANLVAVMLQGDTPPTSSAPQGTTQGGAHEQTRHAPAQPHRTDRLRSYPKVNIKVNCGATIIGDRNIVGPGLGDMARHMQMLQRNQAAAAAHQQSQMKANRTVPVSNPGLGISGCGKATMTTPAMNRSDSFGSESETGGKRKAEDGEEQGCAKRR